MQNTQPAQPAHAAPAAGIAQALTELIFRRELTVEQAVRLHFTDDYRQRTDGVWSDRAEFIDHIEHLRGVVASGHIEVHEELREGSAYADRHTVHVVKTDGSAASVEVYLFAQLAEDGRLHRVQETTLMLAGSEADRGLGSAR